MENKKNPIFNFGETIEGFQFKVLNERAIRAGAGIMFLLGLYASINAFILKNYEVVPYISGILLVNFLIAVLINPRFAPIMFIAKLIVSNQTVIPVGAIQKKFAWFLGIALSGVIFVLSLQLVNDPTFFEPVCFLCLVCLFLLFFETAFGICIGCKLYYLAINLKLIKEPEVKPNCMGDTCDV